MTRRPDDITRLAHWTFGMGMVGGIVGVAIAILRWEPSKPGFWQEDLLLAGTVHFAAGVFLGCGIGLLLGAAAVVRTGARGRS